MGYKDLREFIAKLEKEGELHRIKAEVDWNLELGAIMRRVSQERGPALLFEKVKDTKLQVFSGAFLDYKKYAVAVESYPDMKSLIEKVLRAINNPIPPILTDSHVPCKENIDTGEKINLERFPAPKWHHLDGGRYIGTLGVVITRDPETGIRNMGVYREQMLGKNKVGILATQHIGTHLQKYRARNKPMPVATAIGVPPAVLAAACVQVAYGEDELGIAGAIAGEPIPMVKCETIDLEVPATSEIVFEGEIPPDPNLWEEEGPFAEYPGHVSGEKPIKRPVVFLNAVTYRDNPIYQGTSPGVPPNEDTFIREIGCSAGILSGLLKLGIPGVKEVYEIEMGCAAFICVVSMERQYYLGNARQVIDAVFTINRTTKWAIVVDDDIDIYDWGQVTWALATRVQPHRDIIITDDRHTGSVLDPSVHPDVRNYPTNQSSKIGIDATTQYKGYKFPPVVRTAEEQIKLLKSRWKEYGFK
jgi:UbiD family decarboxylase